MVVKTIKGGVACISCGADLYNKAAHKLLQSGGMATIICKTEADKKKATKDISNKLEQIKKLTAECVMLADENGLDFSLDTPRQTLSYVPESHPDYYEGYNGDNWHSSSDGC